jgi:hypothetical protein
MTIRSRTLGCLLIAFALAAPVAGCSAKSESSNGGTGALGDAPAGAQDAANGAGPDGSGTTPTPTPAPPEEETPEEETPAPGVTLTLGPLFTVNPGLLVLPWPSPADCVSHNPANITTTYEGGLWKVVDGSHSLMAFKQLSDATAASLLAKGHKKHCFIGRSNTRPERERYIMDYWLEPVAGAAPVPSPDCIAHNPANLTIHDLGADGWRVQDGSQYIVILDTKTDAEDAVKVMKHYNRNCYIGRGYAGADRLKYIVNWFASV